MNAIAANLTKLRQQIILAEQRYNRQPGSVKLLAVSKTQPLMAIRAAMEAGQYAFGENYLQEAVPKIIALKDPLLEWHFIGRVQANKTKEIAQYFQWAHGIDNLRVAERLSRQRSTDLPLLNICIQVNLDNEGNKGGALLTNLSNLARQISDLPNIKLRGLMAIPIFYADFDQQRSSFQRLYKAFKSLNDLGLKLDTLSMGMSEDFVAAIAEGSTIVRIGTAIFGQRT